MRKLILLLLLAAAVAPAQVFTNASKLKGKPPCSATVTTNCVPVIDSAGALFGSIAPAPLAYHGGLCLAGVAGWRGSLPSSNSPTATGCASERPVLQFSSGQAAQYWWAEYPVPSGVSNAVYEYTGHFRSADTTHSLAIGYAWECLAPGSSYDSPAFNDGSGTWTVGAVASTGTQATTTITTTCDAGQITAIKFTPTLTSFTQAMDWIDLYTPIAGVAGPTGAAGSDGTDGDMSLPAATFASAPTDAAVGKTYWFSDASAAGTCSGGGSAKTACRCAAASGGVCSSWEAVGGGGSGVITKSINIDAPSTVDTNKYHMVFGSAVTIARIWCSTDTGTVSINFDERAEATPNTAGTDVLGSALVCDSDTQATTTFSNASIAARVPLNLQITATASSPTIVRIHVEAQ